MKTQAQRIKYVRKLYRLTQEQFAEKMGVQRGAVGNWELGKGIKTKNLTLISDRFNVSMDWLANRTGEPPTRGLALSAANEDDPTPSKLRVFNFQ